MPYSSVRREYVRRLKEQKGTEKQEIETWQKRWREAGPIEFAEKLLVCPSDVPPHPDFDPNNNPVLPCNDDCPLGKEHPKFRENGTPYHLILSDDEKEFLMDVWKNGVTMAIIAAARGTGKTFTLAIYNCWRITCFDKWSITCMGGSSEQSENIQDYIDDWRLDIPTIRRIIYKSLRGIKPRVKTRGRSTCRFPACSTQAARGKHVNTVEIDEACEAESKSENGAKAVAAVQWQTTGKRYGELFLSSTVQYIYGIFYDYMKDPDKYGFQKVYRWAIAKHISGETDPNKVYTDKDPSHWIPKVWWITKSELMKKRLSKSDEEWLCEALGGASITSGAVFKKEDLDVCICNKCEECEPYVWEKCKLCEIGKLGTPEDSTKYVIDRQAGFDYGYSNAPCSLTIVGRKGDTLFVLFNDEQIGMRDTDKPDWIDKTCQQYKVHTFIPDPNAAGKHLNEPLEEKGYAVYIIAENEKTERVYKAINFVEKHKIIIPKAYWYLTSSLRKLCWDKNGKIKKYEDHCVSNDTEILSENGWKLFKDLQPNEKVATRSSEGFLEYQIPTEIISMDYNGVMYEVDSKVVSGCFSPNHNWVIQRDVDYGYHKNNNLWLSKYDELPLRFFVSANAKWKGKNNASLQIGKYVVNTDDFFAFMGLWITEGWTNGSKNSRGNLNYLVGLSQSYPKAEKVKELLDRLPFKYREVPSQKCLNNSQFLFNNKDLWELLRPFGKAKDKYLPNWMFDYSTEYLRTLYEWMIFGDGSKCSNRESFFTSSKRLADDFQRLLLHIGFKGNVVSYIKNGFKKNTLIYTVNVRKTKATLIRKINVTPIDYHGKIFCVNVPNHIIFVRRNGKVMWTGNSFDSLCYSMEGFEVEEDGENVFEEFLRFQRETPTPIKEETFFKEIKW